MGGDYRPLPATGREAAANVAAAGDAAVVDRGGVRGVVFLDLVLADGSGLEGSPLLVDVHVGSFVVDTRVAGEVLRRMGREGCCMGAEAEDVVLFRGRQHA